VCCLCSRSQVWTHFQLIFPSKPWGFWWFIWIFSDKNHLKFNISPILTPNLMKYIPLNLHFQDLSNNTKGTSQFLWNVQFWFHFIFNENFIQYFLKLLHHKSKHHETKPRHPSLSRVFQKYQEHDLVNLIVTKQTTLLHT